MFFAVLELQGLMSPAVSFLTFISASDLGHLLMLYQQGNVVI